jgi:astacin (peptidase family M12A)
MTAPTEDDGDGVTGTGQFRVGPRLRTGLMPTRQAGPKAVQYTIVDGEPMVEGDIVLTLLDESELVLESVVITGDQFRWPGGRIPFEIDPNLPSQARVTDAIEHWHRNTRIRLVPRNPADPAHVNFVRFQPGGGCSSQVGMRGNQQEISLAPGCGTGSTIHEIGHTVGLWHEQSREDRNTFVTVNWPNIEPQNAHNFNQHITDGDDIGDYDYHSIMHYPRRAFAIDAGQDTITPVRDVEIGQREGLSPGDCAGVRWMYRNLEPAAVFSGTQFTGSVPAQTTKRWFTHSWPAAWYVVWTVVPTGPAVDGPAQVEWTVQVTRQSGGLLKYFLSITNLTAAPIDIQARYDVLGWSLSAT